MKWFYVTVYAWLFRAMPDELRRRYGADALAMTSRRIEEARGLGTFRVVVRELADLARSIVRERRRFRRDGVQSKQGRFEGWRVDLKSAWRSLRRRPGSAALVISLFALGLGATTATFSVVDAVLLRPLPYPHGRALVRITEYEPKRNLVGASFPAMEDWSHSPSLIRVAGSSTEQLLFREGSVAERARGAAVSPGFFATLGSTANLGRVFDPNDVVFDPNRRIVLGDSLWRRQFNADASVIGRTVVLEERPYTIVGVMPPGFSFPDGTQFWTSLSPEMRRIADARTLRFLDVIGQLAPSSNVEDLERELIAWQQSSGALVPEKDRREVRVRLVHDELVDSVRPALRVVTAGVGLLLLAACANVAALMLARGRRTALQLVLESALGASRWRLVRRQVLEVILLGLGGAAGGLAMTAALRTAIITFSADQIPRISTLAIDARVFAFAVLCAIGTATLAALGPALLLTRATGGAGLPQVSARVAGSRTSRRVFGALVAVEVALAVSLAAGATLLLQSYVRLRQVGTGVDPTGVAVVSLNFPLTPAWRSDAAVHGLIRGMRDGVLAIPGITHAAFNGRLPLDPVRGGIEVETGTPGSTISTVYSIASDGYFATVGARLLVGRDIADTDNSGAPPVAVINDVLARRLFGDARHALDKTVSFQHMRGPVGATVVGVFEAIRYDGLRGQLRAELFQSYQQAPVYPGVLVYRAAQAPLRLAPAIRTVLAQVDPSSTVTLERWTTLEAREDRAIAQPRFFLVVVGTFAITAVILAMLGIHGTLSHWITERRRELGIRVALGADRWTIARLVILRGIGLATAGVAIGLVITLIGGSVLSNVLFGVSATEPATLMLVAVGVVVFAAAVCTLPARQAMALDPVETLKRF